MEIEVNTKEILLSNLDSAKKDIKVSSYSFSVGEMCSMYERGELILKPEYQRFFRWTNEQKSKLIESVLIGLPLPSFFVSQDDDGRWEVVDGMQRISSIFDFIGILNDKAKEQPGYKRFEALGELYYLSDFKDKSWNDLPSRVQLDFKRSKIQIEILLRETSNDSKFEMFQRLNSGGTKITGQELRNAILAGESKELLEWIDNLSKNTAFVKTTRLSDKEVLERYDMELILRFLVFSSPHMSKLSKFNSVEVFLTHVMRDFINEINEKKFNYTEKESSFSTIFEKLNAIDNGWSPFASAQGKFSVSKYEVILFGILGNLDNLEDNQSLKNKIMNLSENQEFKDNSGTGKNARARTRKLIELGQSLFKKKSN